MGGTTNQRGESVIYQEDKRLEEFPQEEMTDIRQILYDEALMKIFTLEQKIRAYDLDILLLEGEKDRLENNLEFWREESFRYKEKFYQALKI
jgi:hypothetical protein